MKFLPGLYVNPRKLVNSCHFYRFLNKKFCPGYGSTFGSSGAHTYLKSGQVAPSPLGCDICVDLHMIAIYMLRMAVLITNRGWFYYVFKR